MISSGRTDRGVHASMQVSNFKTSSTIPTDRLEYALNRGLPEDINIMSVEDVDDNFNSRFDAKTRTYEYILSWEKTPFRARYETFINKKIDIDKFKEILQNFIGIHDFNNFRMSDCGSKTSVREIYNITAEKIDDYRIKVRIVGNAFLKSQIRIIIQTSIDTYFGRCEKDCILKMLNNPNKTFKKRVASPNGLYLAKIEY